MSKEMNNMRQEIIKLIDDIVSLEKQATIKEKELNKVASELLDVLFESEKWKVMVKSCLEHIERYKDPKDFFKGCRIDYFSNHTINWVKGYSNDDDYIVLTLDLKKSVQENIDEMSENMEKLFEIEKKKQKKYDLKLYNEIKKKYNLK